MESRSSPRLAELKELIERVTSRGIAKHTRDMLAKERIVSEEKYFPSDQDLATLVHEAFSRTIRTILFVNEAYPHLYGLHIILPIEKAMSKHLHVLFLPLHSHLSSFP
jgi:hypothetical protein